MPSLSARRGANRQKRVYSGTDFDRRTIEMYLQQLETAIEDKEPFMGIKGPSWLTDYIYIPLQVFLSRGRFKNNFKSVVSFKK